MHDYVYVCLVELKFDHHWLVRLACVRGSGDGSVFSRCVQRLINNLKRKQFAACLFVIPRLRSFRHRQFLLSSCSSTPVLPQTRSKWPVLCLSLSWLNVSVRSLFIIIYLIIVTCVSRWYFVCLFFVLISKLALRNAFGALGIKKCPFCFRFYFASSVFLRV